MVPTPVESIIGERRCRDFCCVDGLSDAARYMFEDQLYKCFNNQTDFNLTQALPPDEEVREQIERAKVCGRHLSRFNIISSGLYILGLE